MKRLLIAAALLAAAAGCSREPPATAAVSPEDAAIRLFERRTEADPRDHLSATTLAELHLRRAERTGEADFRRAEEAARTALERQPGHPAATVALARSAAGQGRSGEAFRLIDDLLSLQPRHVGALEAAFDLAFAAGREREAAAFADRLLAVNEEPGTLRRMAQLADRRGDGKTAALLLRRAAADAADLGALEWEVDDYRRREAEIVRRMKETPR